MNRVDRRLSCWLLVLGLLAIAAGCNDAVSSAPEPKTADEVLDRMVAAYKRAQTYSDSGEARLTYDAGGQHIDEPFNFALSFARPNKLRMNFYQCNVVSDGKDFRAAVSELPNQVLAVPAPATLTTADVYSSEVLVSALAEQVAGGSIQLALLLDDRPLVPILDGARPPVLLPAKTLDDAPCYRVEVPRDDGGLVFWIDRNSYVLRRVELPTLGLEKFLNEQYQTKVVNLSLVADLKGARFDAPIDPVAFKFEAPADARLVEKFNVVPKPEPPSPHLGKPIPEFEFVDLAGKPISRDSLKGKIVVIDFWATWCGPCFQNFPNLEQVYERFANHDKVVFLAVSIDKAPPSGPRTAPISQTSGDDPTVSNAELHDAFQRAKLRIPIARDLKQFANLAFGVQQIPNMFILGPDGVVQDHEIGINPELAKELPERIEKLLAGKSIFEETKKRYEARVADYEAQFKTSANQAQPAAADMTRAVIVPASEPTVVKLTKLWSCDAIKEPGNILATTSADGTPRILVNDGWTAIAELDREGKLDASHKLVLPQQPEDGIVSFLRTTVDSDGKRYFVGAAVSRQQMHVFDDKFKRLFSYPESSVGGIADVEPADLDGDGHPELNVSYYDVVGVQNVSLTGERNWGNRSLANVFRIAVTGPDAEHHRRLLCSNERGSLVPIDYQGRDSQPLEIPRRFLRAVYSADFAGDGAMQYCALAAIRSGEEAIIGFDLSGRELWSYPLPAGLQTYPALEMVAAGNVLGAKVGQWVVAGSDGSLHLLSPDGTLIDRIQLGSAISGLALADLGQPVVLVSTGKAVEAWKIELR